MAKMAAAAAVHRAGRGRRVARVNARRARRKCGMCCGCARLLVVFGRALRVEKVAGARVDVRHDVGHLRRPFVAARARLRAPCAAAGARAARRRGRAGRLDRARRAARARAADAAVLPAGGRDFTAPAGQYNERNERTTSKRAEAYLLPG